MYYFDYAATTPVAPAVAEAMVDTLTQQFGNPSAQYPFGRCARDAVAAHRLPPPSAVRQTIYFLPPAALKATTGPFMLPCIMAGIAENTSSLPQ